MKKRTVFIITAAVLVATGLIALAVWVVFFNKTSNTDTKPRTSTSGIVAATEAVKEADLKDNKNLVEFVDKYGSSYDEIRAEVMVSDPAKWDKEILDKVYFLIEYNYQIQEYRAIGILLDQLDVAKQAGVDIDNNSVGVTQAYRDDMRKKTNEAMQSPNLLPPEGTQ